MNKTIIWTGTTNQIINWSGGNGMIQYRIPIRSNVPQLLQYTFKDQSGSPINLSNYVIAALEIELQGTAFLAFGASITNSAAGQVQYSNYTFATTGVWTVQFRVMDIAGNRLYGEPVQFTVVPNVEDMTGSQLLSY